MVKEMNVYDIKNKANEVLRQPNQLFKVILYVGIIQALFSALSGLFDGILGSIISFNSYFGTWNYCSVFKGC